MPRWGYLTQKSIEYRSDIAYLVWVLIVNQLHDLGAEKQIEDLGMQNSVIKSAKCKADQDISGCLVWFGN